MHSTTIFLLALGLLATTAMARPEHRPWPGHHNQHEDSDNEMSEGHHGHKWTTYRLPNNIRVPRLFAQKLGRPWPTFTAKRIFNDKYLLISPALMFKLKAMDNDTDSSTTTNPSSSTVRPTRSTTEQPIIDEESTTMETIESGEQGASRSFFRKRFFEEKDDDNEQLFFLDDK